MKKIAINGMGRIGRATLKIILAHEELELMAFNDIAPLDTIPLHTFCDMTQCMADMNIR